MRPDLLRVHHLHGGDFGQSGGRQQQREQDQQRVHRLQTQESYGEDQASFRKVGKGLQSVRREKKPCLLP